jgi:hypothetical protein
MDAQSHLALMGNIFGRLLLSLIALIMFFASATPIDLTFALRIENGHVPESMRLIRVTKNDVVKLQWTTDRPMTIHLHGYNIEKKLASGVTTEMTFTANATGRFTIAPHVGAEASGGHAHGDALVTIEVYP